MQTTLVNSELAVTYPDSFHIMDAKEQLEAYVDDNPCRWCIKDGAERSMVSVIWHDAGKLVVRLTSTKSLAKRAESQSRRIYRGYSYALGGFFSRHVGGEEAEGFRFEYTLDGEVFIGQTIVAKHGSCCYTIYWYAPKTDDKKALTKFEDILGALDFV